VVDVVFCIEGCFICGGVVGVVVDLEGVFVEYGL